MEALVETIVSKLRRLSVSKLQIILEFVNFLDWQESQANKVTYSQEQQFAWSSLVKECAGAWPDFPNSEEIRSDIGQDAPREPF
ncbi:MAG: hypothetical protein AAGA83_22320 [Cyanobacteria bacterium P01_F01_bin.116]